MPVLLAVEGRSKLERTVKSGDESGGRSVETEMYEHDRNLFLTICGTRPQLWYSNLSFAKRLIAWQRQKRLDSVAGKASIELEMILPKPCGAKLTSHSMSASPDSLAGVLHSSV